MVDASTKHHDNISKSTMFDIITETNKDPLGRMMLDFLDGRHDVFVEVESSDVDMWVMTGTTMFRTYEEMDELEQVALQLCDGRVLDVGAGSGCHSLYLQDNKREVDALEISPGCVDVMVRRTVKNAFHQNVFSLEGRRYKTILMLMNGLGICGTLDGLNLFLQFIKTILDKGGQLIADSTDLRNVSGARERDDMHGDGYFGETEFVMSYEDAVSDPFEWLYVDFKTLQGLVEYNELQCEQIAANGWGRYLARIY